MGNHEDNDARINTQEMTKVMATTIEELEAEEDLAGKNEAMNGGNGYNAANGRQKMKQSIIDLHEGIQME